MALNGYGKAGTEVSSELQEAEFAAGKHGYTGARHQREVGTGYLDQLNTVIAGGFSPLAALSGSTEEEQFHAPAEPSQPPRIAAVA